MKRILGTIFFLLVFLGAVSARAQGIMQGRVDGTDQPQAVNVGTSGEVRIDPLSGATFDTQPYVVLQTMESVTGWSAINNDCTGLTTDLDHVMGSKSIEFDKVDGTANTVFAVVQKTITSVDLTDYIDHGGSAYYTVMISDTVDVSYCLLRMGTSSSHYNEWRVQDNEILDGWNLLKFPIYEPSSSGATGNGWDESAVTYVALGCAFDAETDTLADIRADDLFVMNGITVEVTEGSTAEPAPREQIYPVLDADDTAACLAIPAAETDYTLTHDATQICASGNTVYILCAAAAPVAADHTVGNFSIVVPDGTCFGPYEFTGLEVCSYIGVAAGGFVCFNGVDYH